MLSDEQPELAVLDFIQGNQSKWGWIQMYATLSFENCVQFSLHFTNVHYFVLIYHIQLYWITWKFFSLSVYMMLKKKQQPGGTFRWCTSFCFPFSEPIQASEQKDKRIFLLDSCSPEQALGIRLESIQDVISQVKQNKKQLAALLSCAAHKAAPKTLLNARCHTFSHSFPLSPSGQALSARAGAAQRRGSAEAGDLPHCHPHSPQKQKAQEAKVGFLPVPAERSRE